VQGGELGRTETCGSPMGCELTEGPGAETPVVGKGMEEEEAGNGGRGG
jgi:hypothetical protein